MYDRAQTYLDIVVKALKELRIAYSKVKGNDLKECNKKFELLIGLLGTTESAEILDRRLRTKGIPSVIYDNDRRRVLSVEERLLNFISERRGMGRDMSKVKKASKKLTQPGVVKWVTSTADCLTLIRDSHNKLERELEPASQMQIRCIRRNKRRLERADTAVLAVGILLVDFKEIGELPNSYAIGAHIASLTDMA